MGWTNATTRSTGDIITASIWNVDLVDNLDFLETQELYVPVTVFIDAATSVSLQVVGRYPVAKLESTADSGHMSFRCPANFSSITTASIIVIPRASQASANWNIHSTYAATGEGHTTNSESDTVSTYNVTDLQVFEVDVSGILTSLAANDIVGLQLAQDTAGHNVDVVGFFMKYVIG